MARLRFGISMSLDGYASPTVTRYKYLRRS
jgi:hypothetical protein